MCVNDCGLLVYAIVWGFGDGCGSVVVWLHVVGVQCMEGVFVCSIECEKWG